MPRSFSWNAWESNVASPITDVGTSLTLESEVGLRAPGYLVIEPESPTKREYIYFASLNGATLEGLSRGLGGSIDGGVAHDVGVKVRAVAMHQMFDDLWDSVGSGSGDLTNHINDPNDPHALAGYFTQAQGDARYVNLSGNTMEGPLDMGSFPLTGLTTPAADTDAATKAYVDTAPYLPLVGGIMSGDIDMGGFVVRNIKDVDEDGNEDDLVDHSIAIGESDVLLNGFATILSVRSNQVRSFQLAVSKGGGRLYTRGLDGNGPEFAPWNEYPDKGYVDGLSHARYDDAEAVTAMGVKANSNDLNHDRYTDTAARAAVDNNIYLKLSGGVMSGHLTLPGGTNVDTSLRFVGMSANDGMYGTENEMSVSFDGQRKFSVFSTASGQSANVVVRASNLVPFKIERQITGGDAAFMMRFTQTGVGEVLLNMGALRWLADNHNTL